MILEKVKLKNKLSDLEDKLKKQDIKIGDIVNVIYYEPFESYKTKIGKVIGLKPTMYDTSYSFKVEFKDKEVRLVDKIDVELVSNNDLLNCKKCDGYYGIDINHCCYKCKTELI